MKLPPENYELDEEHDYYEVTYLRLVCRACLEDYDRRYKAGMRENRLSTRTQVIGCNNSMFGHSLDNVGEILDAIKDHEESYHSE